MKTRLNSLVDVMVHADGAFTIEETGNVREVHYLLFLLPP